MSVKKENKTDTLNTYFTELAKFNNMKEHLLTTDFSAFIRWFDKLRIIEPRATYLYIQENIDVFTQQELNYVYAFYDKNKLKGD